MAPVQLDGAELRSHRERSPLVELLPLFRELLGRIATEARHLMAVGDASARLLWVEGHPVLRRRAEHMNFVEGAAWNERAAGTNAPGTAIALNAPGPDHRGRALLRGRAALDVFRGAHP